MTTKQTDRGAVLQFEWDRNVVYGYDLTSLGQGGVTKNYTAQALAEIIARRCMDDVFKNCGTLVLVVSDKKCTIVQRPKGSDEI